MQLANSGMMRDLDSQTINIEGYPSTLLMKNAARAVAEEAMVLAGKNKTAAIFCGSGNNGGDGIAAAIHLLRQGFGISCYLVGTREKMTAGCAEMERRLIELGGKLLDFESQNPTISEAASTAGVIIDALFGLGLNSPLRDLGLACVKIINASPSPVVSADIPSGVNADTGEILGDAVTADVTVTFSMAKIGHFVQPGCCNCGKLKIVDIGIPHDLLSQVKTQVFAVNQSDLALPRRPRVSHKGDYNRLLIVGGSVGYTGAPLLCTSSAARSGVGLISLGVPRSIYPILAGRLWEPMPFPLDESPDGKISLTALPEIIEHLSKSQVCLIGCGLGRSDELTLLVRSMIKASSAQLVIDADGLFALGQDAELIKSAKKPPILTPHEGEFLRLGGVLTGDRGSDARSFSQSRNCILVLKGHRTICAFPDGSVYIISAGNPGMAKGGSGDVLAGIIAALCCQLETPQAVITACFIHAAAGDLAASRLGEYSMLPQDIIDEMPNVMINLER